MENVRRVGFAAVAAALLAWLPGQVQAQEVGFAVDGYGGIALPASNLNEFQDIGPSFGLGVEYDIIDQLFLRASGQVDLHTGRDADEMQPPLGGNPTLNAPDVTLFHFTGGLGFQLVPPEDSPWDVSVSLEVGGTSVSSDDFPDAATPPGQFPAEGEDPSDEADFSETYFNVSPGVRVGYAVNPQFDVFFRSQPHFAFADEDRTRAFAQFDKGVPQRGFDNIWNLPITAGVKVNF